MKIPKKLYLLFGSTFLLMSVTGCEKDSGVPVDYGPEMSEEAITDALVSAVPRLIPEDIKAGQFVHESHSQQISQGSVSIVSDKYLTVLAREDYEQAIGVNIREHALYYTQDGQYKKESREGPLYFARTQTLALSALSALSKISLHASSDSQTRVTFHRLTSREEEVSAPPLVRKQADCGGLLNPSNPDCKMRVRTVSYDAVVWNSSQGDRIRIEYKFSPDVPFFTGRLYNANSDGNFIPGLMSQCITQLVQVPKSRSKVLVEECTRLENFRFEEPPT